MNIKHTGLALSALLSAFAFTACETTSTNTNANRVNANSNMAVVVNNNSNAVATSNTNSNANRYGSNITREQYEKSRADYERDAKEAASTVGQGANDLWIWTKTRAALTTTEDLRDSTINVDVTNDVVTLRGTVANNAEKTKAETVAKGIEGVKSVKNDLKVAPNDSLTNVNTNSAANANSNTNKK